MVGLWLNIDYAAFVALFCIGLYIVLAKQNLIKKLLGLNIMETAVFAFIVTSRMVDFGAAPIISGDMTGPFASPLPHALILTGIVVALSITALALSLIVEIYRRCGTIEADELKGVE